jgi:glucan-binding YG repeat protein
MVRNAWAADSHGFCWMDENGLIATDRWITYEGDSYYVGSDGYMVTGTQTIDGKTYLFGDSGKLIS